MKIIRNAAILLAVILTTAPAPTAAAEEEVNLYTDRQEVFLRPVLKEFTKQTGVEVNVLFIKSGLRERMRAEGASSPADVVLVVDVGALSDIVADNLTRAAPPALAADLSRVLPAAYRDPNNHWFGVTRRVRVLYVSAEHAANIRDYPDIADPQWRGKVCVRSGRHPYNIGLVSHMIAVYGESAAREWVDGFRQNLARRPQGNDRAQIKGVLTGECHIGVANSYYFFQTLKNAEDDDARNALRAKVMPGASLKRLAELRAPASKMMEDADFDR